MATPNYQPVPVDPASVNPAFDGTAYGVSLADDGEAMRAPIFSAADESALDRIRWLRERSQRGIKTLTSGPATETVTWQDGTALGPASPTSDIVAELSTASVPSAARLRVGRKNAGMSGRTLVVKSGVGGSTIAKIASGDIGWIEAEFNSGAWIVTAWGGVVIVV